MTRPFGHFRYITRVGYTNSMFFVRHTIRTTYKCTQMSSLLLWPRRQDDGTTILFSYFDNLEIDFKENGRVVEYRPTSLSLVTHYFIYNSAPRLLLRLAHTGIAHLHWSFSVDQDVFSLSLVGLCVQFVFNSS